MNCLNRIFHLPFGYFCEGGNLLRCWPDTSLPTPGDSRLYGNKFSTNGSDKKTIDH